MKIALSAGSTDHDHYANAKSMAEAMVHGDDAEVRVESFEGGALGCVVTGDRPPRIPLHVAAPDGSRLAIAGVPIAGSGGVTEILTRAVRQETRAAARTLSRLDGAFAAIHWAAANRTCSVVTDFLGVQPLYICHGEGLLLLASEVQGIAASGAVHIDMDPAGWGAFFCFGHALGDSTQLAGVRRVAPASILCYAPHSDRLEAETYWALDAISPRGSAQDLDSGTIKALLLQDVAAYSEYYSGGTLFFSGGYDSRLLLALLKESGLDVELLVVDHAGHFLGMEAKLAKRAAQNLGSADCRIVNPPDGFYNSADFLRYLAMNEVTSPALSLFISKVSQYVQPEMRAIWQGVGPGHVIRPPLGPPGGIERCFRCASTTSENPTWRAVETVFARVLAESMKDAVTAEVSRLRRHYPGDGNGVWRFTVEHRMRNRSSPNPTQVYANRVLPFTPALNRRLWEMVASLDLETLRSARLARRGDELARRLLVDHFPAAAAVPFCTEEKLYAFQGFHPSLYFMNFCGDSQYYLRRLGITSTLRRVYSRCFSSSATHESNLSLFNLVLSSTDPDDPELNGSTVRMLLREPQTDSVSRVAKKMLFYRQVWRWTIEGRLRVQEANEFLDALRVSGQAITHNGAARKTNPTTNA